MKVSTLMGIFSPRSDYLQDALSVDDSDEIQNGFVFQYLGDTSW